MSHAACEMQLLHQHLHIAMFSKPAAASESPRQLQRGNARIWRLHLQACTAHPAAATQIASDTKSDMRYCCAVPRRCVVVESTRRLWAVQQILCQRDRRQPQDTSPPVRRACTPCRTVLQPPKSIAPRSHLLGHSCCNHRPCNQTSCSFVSRSDTSAARASDDISATGIGRLFRCSRVAQSCDRRSCR